MSTSTRKLKHHVFVCLNERPADNPRGCCKTKGAEEVLAALKSEVAKSGLLAEVRAQKSGCLDVCEHGVSVVIYPEGVWYGGVKPGDAQEIVHQHLMSGKIIERLKIQGK